MDPQATSQAPSQPHRFSRGQSGNPTGWQRSKARLHDLCVAFEAIHHRQATPLELCSLRSAAKLAAAAESPRTSAEQAVRASNTLHRTLVRLGLASPPAKARPRVPTLSELLARQAAAKDGAR
jgi:hypothetical protein